MTSRRWFQAAFAVVLIAAGASSGATSGLVHPDHAEFNATVAAPFKAQAGRWRITLRFDYPFAGRSTSAAWSLQARLSSGRVVRAWSGITPLQDAQARALLVWDGLDDQGRPLPRGYYRLVLRAAPTVVLRSDARRSIDGVVDAAFAAFGEEIVVQEAQLMLGQLPAARMPRFRGLGVGTRSRRVARSGQDAPRTQAVAPGGLPYTIYYGNLHSQTNDSDGGAPVAQCTGASAPQAGTLGPTDAYTMMQGQAGGDFLMTSEHNHMYDGSTGTNASANPADAIALFQGGLQRALRYNAASPGFLAIYGLEWGVISNGGHLNLINADALAGWETNGSGQLIAEVNTPRSNYPALYASMQQRGWIGQFNHPATSGQFVVGGTPSGYDANGAQVMVLAEVLNSSAFSTNTTQTETSRSSYVGAWNLLLERGYKVAPSSNQDNHCGNWGRSFTNRTGVLLADNTPLTMANFVDALRARRAFATEDKTGQLVLVGNGYVMGETFANSGALTLTANYASTSGQSAQRVQFFEGVPGRNGAVTQLSEGSGRYTFTPVDGQHFYYAVVTQGNGLRLWSAPIWVSQGGSATDTIPPTVSAAESGSSGTITLSASASDNVAVTRVDFIVDGVLQGSDSSAPYALAVDSTTLADADHTLIANAYDAAGNVGTSSGVRFTVSNSAAGAQLVVNGGFESASANWVASGGVITSDATYPARAGNYKAWLNGYGRTRTDYAYQTVTLPASLTTASLSLWLRVVSEETTSSGVYDTLKVQLRDTNNQVLATIAAYSNLDTGSAYVQRSFNVAAYKGRTVRVYLEGREDASLATSFLVDDISLAIR